VIISNQDEGAPVPVGPGPSLLGTGESADPAAAPFVPPHEGKSESYDWDFKQTMLLAACTSRRSLPVLPPAFHALDPVGNRGSAVSTLGVVQSGSWTFNADDQIFSENYDTNGNTTRTANGNTYTYDSENHMTSMRSGSTVVTMKYDAFGNRVAKTVNGVTTQYLVEDYINPTRLPQVVEEVQNGAAVRTYTYGLQRISQNQVVNNAWTPSFYGYDGFGSVRQLTNAAGAVTDSYEYDAFGNSFTKQGTTPNYYLYRGEQFDSDLGLYYLRARYYNSVTGRFFSRDPEDGIATDPGTLHKYVFAKGDPVNLDDPTGRIAATATWGGAGAGDLGEEAMLLTLSVAAVPAIKAVACALNTAYDYLAKTIGAEELAIPVPAKCKADCPPCDPPAGTECYDPDSGHPHPKALGWDPHYHLWNQGQDPQTCECHWRENHGSRGAYQFPPMGMYECDYYPSWPSN
jgi:RHS repeat-associated protein